MSVESKLTNRGFLGDLFHTAADKLSGIFHERQQGRTVPEDLTLETELDRRLLAAYENGKIPVEEFDRLKGILKEADLNRFLLSNLPDGRPRMDPDLE